MKTTILIFLLGSWAWGQTREDCIHSKANPNVYYLVANIDQYPALVKGQVPLPPKGCFIEQQEWKLRPGECYAFLHDGEIIAPFEQGNGWQSLANCYYAMREPPPQEPIDVPAIRGMDIVTFKSADPEDMSAADSAARLGRFEDVCKHWAHAEIKWSPRASCHVHTYTCADKSRILLTAEDGKYWCHKPQTAPQ